MGQKIILKKEITANRQYFVNKKISHIDSFIKSIIYQDSEKNLNWRKISFN